MKKINPLLNLLKYFAALLLLNFLCTFIFAQQKSETQYLLKGNDKTEINAFGGPGITFSTVYQRFAILMGGDAGIVFNKILLVGGYGEWYLSDYEKTITGMIDENNDFVGDLDLSLKFNHAGLLLGYINKAEKPIHFGVNSKFGWGSLRWENIGQNEPPIELKDEVFVIIPKVDAEFNLMPWAKMIIGVGYRFVTGIDESYNTRHEGSSYVSTKGIFDSSSFDSFVIDIGFYFGNFK